MIIPFSQFEIVVTKLSRSDNSFILKNDTEHWPNTEESQQTALSHIYQWSIKCLSLLKLLMANSLFNRHWGNLVRFIFSNKRLPSVESTREIKKLFPLITHPQRAFSNLEQGKEDYHFHEDRIRDDKSN